MHLAPIIAALPYSNPPSLSLGPLEFHLFGLLVGTAIIAGSVLASKRAKDLGLDDRVANEIAIWAVVPGMICAHLYSAIFYFPEEVMANPMYLLYFWDGISSFGGFIGGAGGVLYFLRKHQLPFWDYAEPVIYGFVFAWIFGRLGCTFAFDHPGVATDFALAMPYPLPLDGAPAGTLRHNLGFYECIYTVGMFAVLFSQRNRALPVGWMLSVTLILYCPVRFAMDFLRAVDKLYWGLTAGQYAAIALGIAGTWIYLHFKNSDRLLVPDGAVHRFYDGRLAYVEPETDPGVSGHLPPEDGSEDTSETAASDLRGD